MPKPEDDLPLPAPVWTISSPPLLGLGRHHRVARGLDALHLLGVAQGGFVHAGVLVA
jgi:hypothetical protein